MSDEHRPYPPSDYRLRTLREQGIIPTSKAVLNCGVVVGGGIASVLIYRSSSNFIAAVRGLYSQAGGASSSFTSVSDAALSFLIIMLLSVTVSVMIPWLLHTKCYLQRPGRGPWGAASVGEGRLTPLLTRVFNLTLWVAILVLLSFVFVRDHLPQWFSLVDKKSKDLDPLIFWAQEVIMTTGGIVVFWAALVAVLSFIFAVISFRMRHAMSRAELEAEAREVEVRSEIRDAQRRAGQG